MPKEYINFSEMTDQELLKSLGDILEDANINGYDVNSYPANLINNAVYRMMSEIKRRKLKMIRLAVNNERKKKHV